MRIAVFGAGGVGGPLAARLARSGAAVSLVARGEHLAAIRAEGLVLLTGEERFVAKLRASDDAADFGPQDCVIVALKCTQLAGAVASIRPLIGDSTRLVFAMNGLPWWFAEGLPIPPSPALARCLDPGGELPALLPASRVIWGVVTSGGAVVSPGVVRGTTAKVNSITLGHPDDHSDAFIGRLARLLGDAGYAASVAPNIRAAIWSKLLINAGQAMVATATDRDNFAVTSDPETRGVIIAVMHELLAIGAAIGLRLDADPVALTEPSRFGTHVSSFLQDLRAGRPLELPGTILAAREIGRALGLASPHLTTVAAIVAAQSAAAAAR